MNTKPPNQATPTNHQKFTVEISDCLLLKIRTAELHLSLGTTDLNLSLMHHYSKGSAWTVQRFSLKRTLLVKTQWALPEHVWTKDKLVHVKQATDVVIKEEATNWLYYRDILINLAIINFRVMLNFRRDIFTSGEIIETFLWIILTEFNELWQNPKVADILCLATDAFPDELVKLILHCYR